MCCHFTVSASHTITAVQTNLQFSNSPKKNEQGRNNFNRVAVLAIILPTVLTSPVLSEK